MKAKLSGSTQRIVLPSVFLEICTLGCGFSGHNRWWDAKRPQLGLYFIQTRHMHCKACSATHSTVRLTLVNACYSTKSDFCCIFAVTLVNLDNGMRFTNAAWQLIALLPVPSKNAGNYRGRVTLSARKAKLFHGEFALSERCLKTEFWCIFTDCITSICKGLVKATEEF